MNSDLEDESLEEEENSEEENNDLILSLEPISEHTENTEDTANNLPRSGQGSFGGQISRIEQINTEDEMDAIFHNSESGRDKECKDNLNTV